jgi:hypothetical protein
MISHNIKVAGSHICEEAFILNSFKNLREGEDGAQCHSHFFQSRTPAVRSVPV